jgi:hypothetical protein
MERENFKPFAVYLVRITQLKAAKMRYNINPTISGPNFAMLPTNLFMLRTYLLAGLLFLSAVAFPQRIHIGIFGGGAAYQGDLTDRILPRKQNIYGAIGFTGNYELTDRTIIRAGLTYAMVGAADRFSNLQSHILRNLSFETKIVEFSTVAEYYVFNLYEQKYSPYVFGGLAVFHFNPYSYDVNGQKVYLRPLSTEGEGLPQYPDRKPYSLTQMAIPFGGGIKYALNDNLRIGLELGIRKLFTDYLDDVSTTYADQNDLLAAKGQKAVDMAYRGYEVPGGNPNYPNKGEIRGNPKKKDWYYFGGIHLTYRLTANGGGGFFGGNKKGYGCPNVPR